MEKAKTKARVAIADDQAIVRVGIRAILSDQAEFELVGEAEIGPLLLELVEQQAPDLLLLDLGEQSAFAHEIIPEIQRQQAPIKVLMFTAQSARDSVMAAMRAGANGYLIKGSSIHEMLRAMYSVLNGHTYLSPQIAGHLVSAYMDRDSTGSALPSPIGLSQREKQILGLVAAGLTNKEIGTQLFISPRTVEKHRASMMHKLHLKTTAALLAFAIGYGLLDDAQAMPRPTVAIGMSGLQGGAPRASWQRFGISGLSRTYGAPSALTSSPMAAAVRGGVLQLRPPERPRVKPL